MEVVSLQCVLTVEEMQLSLFMWLLGKRKSDCFLSCFTDNQ